MRSPRSLKCLLLWMLVLFVCTWLSPAVNGLEPEEKKVVSQLIKAFKSKHKGKIAEQFSYPFHRLPPIPSIKNKKEMIERFDEVFDEGLVKIIAKSDPDKDWDAVGWRGIMFDHGNLWIDYDGTIIAVHYLTQTEKDVRAELIAQQKKNLHESISTFVEPLLEWKTEHYLIRIDDVGHDRRLAVWHSGKSPSEKPDLVIYHGKYEPEGSGGNHNFSFTDGNNSYVCDVVEIGEMDSPPGFYSIYKGNEYSGNDLKERESILSEPVVEDLLDK